MMLLSRFELHMNAAKGMAAAEKDEKDWALIQWGTKSRKGKENAAEHKRSTDLCFLPATN